MSAAGMELDPIEQPRFLPPEEVESAFYLHLEVEDRPACWPRSRVLGDHEVSVKSVVQKGIGENARLVMVMHPVAEGKFRAAVDADLRARSDAHAAALDPRDRGGVHGVSPAVQDRVPLIERYRDRLPLEPGDPIVTLMEGSTPLVHAPRLSERIGVETHLKFEG